jgi:DNA repair protein RecO (recombination protein O)
MRITLEPSYILHGRSYRESSLLLEALSKSHGRVGLVARGARGARSKWKNMLQPFRPLLLSWNQKSELGTLTGADQIASPPALSGEPLFCGLYVNELLMRFMQRSDPHPGLFDQYSHLVTKLAAGDSPQPLLRLFELELLQAAGFGMQLDREQGSGHEILPDAWYLYVPESGPLRRDPTPAEADGLVSGEALLALKSGEIAARHQKELKFLMRKMIRFYLGPKPLKSQSLFYES